MDRKSSVKDVHKYVPQDLPELYKTLCTKLGEENPFAKFSIGAGSYVWSDNRYHWKKMVDATNFEKTLIQDALQKTIDNVSSKIGSKTAAALFTTPDDSYIYYNDDNGEIKILITGWGFKKPERIIPGGDKVKLKLKNPVKLSFSFDGERIPNYEFVIKLEKQAKHLSTDSNGYYNFSNLKVGEHLVLNDIRSGKEYDFDVIEGQTEYDYDVTTYVGVNVSVLSDHAPVSNEPIKVTVKDRDYTSTTNAEGKSCINVPNHIGENVTVAVRDKYQHDSIASDEIQFQFEFEGEKPKEVYTDIIVSVFKNSVPLQSQNVTIRYADGIYSGDTDSNGRFTQKVVVKNEEVCTVDVFDFESKNKILKEENINEFVFEKTEKKPVTETPEKTFINPRIVVKRENGDIVTDYAISVEYDNTSTQYTSNQEGYVYLYDLEEGKSMIVSDWPDSEIISDYILDHNKEEYEFIIPDEVVQEEPKKQIKVMFRDVQGKPIKCENVVFQQKERNNLTCNLDEQGDTYFDEGIFKNVEPMSVKINGWNNTESYDPIPLTLDNGEYEYLIQEKPSKTSWWMRIAEVISVLGATLGLLLLWPYFEGFCLGMFDVIYN